MQYQSDYSDKKPPAHLNDTTTVATADESPSSKQNGMFTFIVTSIVAATLVIGVFLYSEYNGNPPTDESRSTSSEDLPYLFENHFEPSRLTTEYENRYGSTRFPSI